jgi:mono/diheme cytochrome c family protein
MKFQISLGVIILPLLALPAWAQDQSLPGDAREGHKLARKVCITCHSIEKGERGVSIAGAPAFQDIADDPAVTETGLLLFFRTPHKNMPNLILTPAESDDAIAYILGLR